MNLRFIRDDRERQRFIRFAIVGAIGTVVDFVTFNLLSGVIGMQHIWASVISFCVAVLSNFTWNRFWTYPDSRSKPILKQLGEFAVVNVIGLGIRTPLFSILSRVFVKGFDLLIFLPMGLITSKFLGHNSALAFAIIVVMLWNYFVNRYWTYNDVK
jgi:putative flippase GtrA